MLLQTIPLPLLARMSEKIPYATPYPWDNPDLEEDQRLANQKLRKRPFVGSGLAALQKSAFGSNSIMCTDAQSLLRNLLHQHSVEIDLNVAENSTADIVFGCTVADPDVQSKNAADVHTNDAEVQRRAKAGEISLFLTILKIIDENPSAPVATKEFFKTCCLAVRPGDVPGSMDAKEMVMAALQFLSRESSASSLDLVSLPLIRPLQELADLERRTFHKHGKWTLDTRFKEKVLRLEQIFVSSPQSWKWLKREFLSPRLSTLEESAFFLRGVIPATLAGKKATKETPSRKRKLSSPSAQSNTPGSTINHFEASSDILDASIVADESASHSDS